MRIKIVAAFLIFIVASLYSQDKLEGLRTTKKIIPTESATSPYYAIQILALKESPTDPNFFTKIELAREWDCNDEFVRYTVGEYHTSAEATNDLARIKALGYEQSFVVNTNRYSLGESSSNAALVIDPNKTYTVQLSAFRFPVYLSHFKEYDTVQEYYMKDKIYRYCVGEFLGKDSSGELERAKQNGYKGAFLVELSKYTPYKIE
ncbi:MAG: SPOR domain-containing protein [Breznakibacter sp.]|nr:SPOR domain-containing protein [Breznakibacter sp.]